MADQDFDYDKWNKWTEDAFDRLTELYRHRVATYVTNRFLAMGTGLMTLIGILSFFGLRAGIESATKNAVNELEALTAIEVTTQVAGPVAAELERMRAELERMRESTRAADIETGMSRERAEETRLTMAAAREEVASLIRDLEPLSVSLAEFQGLFTSLQANIDRAQTEVLRAQEELRKGAELS